MTGNVALARRLRHVPTEAEKKLWALLRSRQLDAYKFCRQHHIGRFVADFTCVERRLIIEVDGGQHADNLHDVQRTEFLENAGWRVIRFWNNDILTNAEGVLVAVLAALQE